MSSQAIPDLSSHTICQIVPTLDIGGAERTTVEVGRGIVAAGGRSIVVSEGGSLVEQLEREGSCHHTLLAASKNPMVMAGTRAALVKLIAAEGVTLVHARSRAPAWPAMAAARSAGIPFVTTYHGTYSGRTRLKRLYNSIMARGDVVIANSAYTDSVIKETYGDWRFFDPTRVVTIPRGADLSAFDEEAVTPKRVAEVFDRLGGRDAVRILLPGRLTSWKGQPVVIEAARRLRGAPGLPPLRVAFVGSAQGRESYEEELHAMIESADLSRIVHLAGSVDDMPAAYVWSDIVLSASTRPEAFGRVAVEGMATGRPVIATAHGGSLETVVDGETGRLVAPNDPDALAEAIGALAKDPTVRAAMGAAGRRQARGHFSTEAMVASTLRVYETVGSRGIRS